MFSQAYAHSTTPFYSLEVNAENPWRFSLVSWDPTLIFFILLSILYGYALHRHRHMPVTSWQIFCFYIGIIINIVCLAPWMDNLADQLFFVHMIQHLGIILLGIPLMICGAPFLVLIRFLHPYLRRYIYFPIIRNIGIQKVHQVLSIPIVSLILFNFNFWFWHQPRWYNLALFHDLFHLIEHATMAWTAIYLWRHIIDPSPLRSNLPMGIRVLFLASFMAINIILAAMLTYADTTWYAYEYVPMPEWWAENWDRLDDQRLGGLIMWVPGGIITFCAMSLCFYAWVQREHEQQRCSNT